MKLAYKDIAPAAEMDMSPMIDMVFLLLIFFIVASQVVDAKPEVDIPSADAGMIPANIENRLMVSVKQDGSYYLGLNEAPVSLGEVASAVAAESQDNKELEVVIRADSAVRYEVNEKIVKACAEHGVNNLIYAVYEK